jgi:hypothetical protein
VTGLTRRQRLVRLLYRFVGPAQVGLPPYASEEDRARYAADQNRTPPTVSPAPPPGMRFVTYIDEHGIEHRSAVPDDRAH